MATLVSSTSLTIKLEALCKTPESKWELQKGLIVTAVATAALLALGLTFTALPSLPSVTGKALIGMGTPFFTLSIIGIIWVKGYEKEEKIWPIAIFAAALFLTFGVTASAIPTQIHIPCCISRVIMGVSAPLLATGIVKLIIARASRALAEHPPKSS
ncbi:MAG: hypothetical protein S4CHLAM45_14430 [Chlamydiales bacterium]|nr:hypothetical protein [Chlamydiales bacterium]MCH9620048.1 hypothetical protein [Chlamydiales bacterium]MCH9623533.1 hypothetical protein [Chlamydiales bacterium]